MIVSNMQQEMKIWGKIVLSVILWLSMLAISCQGTDCGNIPPSNGMFYGYENLGEFPFSLPFPIRFTCILLPVYLHQLCKDHTTHLVKSRIDNSLH